MTSYAPMLCHLKHQNWNPDMIYFDNETIDLTPSYETQRLFSKYAGDKFVDTKLSVDTEGMTEAGAADITKRVAATVVVDSKTGKRYLKVVNVLPVELQLVGPLPVELLFVEPLPVGSLFTEPPT